MDERIVPPEVEREVEEEFAFHVEMRVAELVGKGWTEEEARAEAVRRFGNMDRVKADCRGLGERRNAAMGRRGRWDALLQDIRYAVRQLRRAPVFAGVAILTLALAIGANTAVFSVVRGVLLNPLPYPDSQELGIIWSRYLPASGFDIPKFALSGPEAMDYRETTTAFENVGIFTGGSRTLTGDGEEAERIDVGFLSASMRETIGVEPLLGRWFTAAEDVPGGAEVALLSQEVWTRRFGADPSIVGRNIRMNGESVEVIGVMPEGLGLPGDSEAWLPLRMTRDNAGNRASHGYLAVGRLAQGATFEQASAELEVLRERWAAEYEHNEAHYLWTQPFRTEVVADAPGILRLLTGAVLLVLLIACANVANLLMARAERRQGEVGLRQALGADRGRITRQLLTESLVLAGIAAAVGVVLAVIGTRILIALDPDALPRLDEARVDGLVLVFTVGVAVGTALLFGMIPAWLSGRRVTSTLASSSGRAAGSRGRTSLRRLLVAGEVGVSVVVVILAGLLVRSLTALSSQDPRMAEDHLVAFSLNLPPSAYPDRETVHLDFERITEGLAAVPGVEAVTAATFLPFQGSTMQWDFQLDDRPPRQQGDRAWNAHLTMVQPGYVDVLGMELLRGRSLTAADDGDAPLVGLINRAMAETYWPGEEALGQRWGYAIDDSTTSWITVVGVVENPVRGRVDEDPYPHAWVPLAQAARAADYVPRSLRIAARTAVAEASVVPALRRAVAEADPDLPIYELYFMEDAVSDSLAQPRLVANLLGVFGLLALVLALSGIYGVLAYSVAGRRREIGVRVALGAGRSQVVRMIVSEGVRPVVLGVVLGLAGAALVTRFLQSLLYGVAPLDPVTFAAVPALLLGAAALASWLPARRAANVPPTQALQIDG